MKRELQENILYKIKINKNKNTKIKQNLSLMLAVFDLKIICLTEIKYPDSNWTKKRCKCHE